MRRVVTVFVLVMVAGALAACSSGTPTDTTGTPVPAAPAPGVVAAAPVPANGDQLSPLPVTAPGEAFPTDPASVPQVVLDNLTAKKPMLLFWFDPTTGIAGDQRRAIALALKNSPGRIASLEFDYTTGLSANASSAVLPPETDKLERMGGLLKVKTTPYLVFVNASGQVTHRFAGYADHVLIEREILRAIQ